MLIPLTGLAEDKVAEAIKYTVTPNHRISLFPYTGTKAYTSPEYRLKLSSAFSNASKYFDIPVGLLIAMGYRESVFRPDLKGPNGELGILQVGEYGRKKCKEYCTEIDTLEGGAMCGACWLDMGRQWCKGDLIKGLRAYISGKCVSDAELTKRVLRQRLEIWAILAGIIKQ